MATTFSIPFRDNLLELFSQLHISSAQELAKAALEKASEEAKSPEEVIEIFRDFGKNLSAIEGQNREISDRLSPLLEDEENRVTHAWRQYCEQMWRVPLYKGMERFACEGYQTAAKKRAQAERTKLAANLCSIISHPEAQGYYRLVFGEDLPLLPDIFKEREKAEAEGETEAVQQIDAEIEKAYIKLTRLEREWDALPEYVKALYGFPEKSKILTNPEFFNSALIAVRSYNLVCVVRKLNPNWNIDISTKELLIHAGEMAAQNLREQSKNLTELHLFRAGITCLPIEITYFSNLTDLLLYDNSLSALPPQIGNLSKLEHLNIAQNKITSVPAEIGNLRTLELFYMDDNLLPSIPPEIGKLCKLRDLLMNKNRLTSLPSEFGNLEALHNLDISNNLLSSTPTEIENLTELETLRMSHNLFTSLPQCISKLFSLVELHIDHNKLTSVPPEMGDLRKLKKLNLRYNQIPSLPSEIADLPSLASLRIEGNKLTSLPQKLCKRKLDIDDQSLTHPR